MKKSQGSPAAQLPPSGESGWQTPPAQAVPRVQTPRTPSQGAPSCRLGTQVPQPLGSVTWQLALAHCQELTQGSPSAAVPAR
jgi:hypothetical protein